MKKAFIHSAKFLIPFTSLTPNTHKQKEKRLGLKTLQAKDTGMDENGVFSKNEGAGLHLPILDMESTGT